MRVNGEVISKIIEGGNVIKSVFISPHTIMQSGLTIVLSFTVPSISFKTSQLQFAQFDSSNRFPTILENFAECCYS